jgi:hypothetical protein
MRCTNAAIPTNPVRSHDAVLEMSASAFALVVAGLVLPLPFTIEGVAEADAPHSGVPDGDVIGKVVVTSPITSTVDEPTVPIEIGTFPTVIAWPGARVWPASTYFVVPSTTVVETLIASGAFVAWTF